MKGETVEDAAARVRGFDEELSMWRLWQRAK